MKEALRNVTLRQLQIFMVAAENESYARAAELLYLTQPAVSMQMKRLTEMVGIDLFVKDGRNLKLTLGGKSLLPYARQVTQTLSEASEALDAIHGLRHGQIKLGMVTATKYFSPRLIEEFKKKYPEIDLDVTIANRRDIVSKLESNELDLAIMGRTPKRLEVNSVPFYSHPYVIIAPPSHPLVGKKNIPKIQLMKETFLVREVGSGTRLLSDYFLTEEGMERPTIQEYSSSEFIKQSVMAGVGLSVISAHTIHLEQKTNLLSVLSVKGMPIMRTWFILNVANKRLSLAAEAFRLFMEKDAPKHMKSIFS